MARPHHTAPSQYGTLDYLTNISTSGKKSDSRAYRKAEYINLPGAGELGASAGENIASGPGELGSGEAWTAPAASRFGTSKIFKDEARASRLNTEMLEPYKQQYYTDMFDAAKDFYYRERSPEQIMQETDPNYAANLAEGETLSAEKAILPHQILYDYANSPDSPYRNLRDIKEEQGDLLGEYAEGIETEEEAIDTAKGLYKEKEKAFSEEKEAKIASGIKTEQGAEATIAQQGYEIGPAEKELALAKKAGDVDMGSLYQNKRLAQEERQEGISTAIGNIEGIYDDASDAYQDIQQSESDYGASFGQGSQFWNTAKSVIDSTRFKIAEVQSATNEMFASATQRAKDWGGAHPYKGSGPKHWKESSGMKSEREAFSGVLDTVQTNIDDLASFFPSAENIGQASVEPYLEGGDFSWLGEGYDPEAYSFDD